MYMIFDFFDKPITGYYENKVQEFMKENINYKYAKKIINEDGKGYFEFANEKIINDFFDENNFIINEKNKLIENVKKKANEIILSKHEYTKQLNFLKRIAQLQDIIIFGGTLTNEQLLEYNELKAVGNWIDFIRDQSNTFETEINNLDSENLKTYEINYNMEL